MANPSSSQEESDLGAFGFKQIIEKDLGTYKLHDLKQAIAAEIGLQKMGEAISRTDLWVRDKIEMN